MFIEGVCAIQQLNAGYYNLYSLAIPKLGLKEVKKIRVLQIYFHTDISASTFSYKEALWQASSQRESSSTLKNSSAISPRVAPVRLVTCLLLFLQRSG